MRTIPIPNWSYFRNLVDGDEFRSWAFRGQADAVWQLHSSLTRKLLDAGVHSAVWKQQEERILRIFKRKAHLFIEHVPDVSDAFQWLALMQHHGAPTRLLDFTWSPYVAAFFAIESATSDAAVWAICPPKVTEIADKVLPKVNAQSPDAFNFRGAGNFESYFLLNKHQIVYVGEPYVMNKRLIAQEGTFVVPGVIDRTIDDILNQDPASDEIVAKLVLDTKSIRREAMRSLYQMNITHASLFPDLEGLAKSMAYELEFHWAYDPYTTTPVPGFP